MDDARHLRCPLVLSIQIFTRTLRARRSSMAAKEPWVHEVWSPFRQNSHLGITLVERTTRSVRLAPAGERLYEAVRPAKEEVRAAEAAVKELGAEPPEAP